MYMEGEIMDSLFLYLLALIVPLIASININATYSKYKREGNGKKVTGFEVARKILDENGMKDMYIVEVRGELSDHYDPTQKVVRLSSDIYHGESIAAMAVAAHECGHAIQDKENYAFLRVRSTLCPIVNFTTYIAYVLFFISIFLEMVDGLMIAVIMVFMALTFQLVTLPVEFDASKRALEKLKEYDLVQDKENEHAEKVLKAAALTYVAAVLSSVLNLIRLLMVMSRRNDR